MRVLFTFAGGLGHFQPLIPLARAVAAAGHTVAFAAGAARREAIETAGFTAFAVGKAGGGHVPERQPLLVPDRDREDRDLRDGFVRRGGARRLPHYLDLFGRWPLRGTCGPRWPRCSRIRDTGGRPNGSGRSSSGCPRRLWRCRCSSNWPRLRSPAPENDHGADATTRRTAAQRSGSGSGGMKSAEASASAVLITDTYSSSTSYRMPCKVNSGTR